MRELIKRAIAALYPEIDTGWHVPRYARVIGVADPPTSGDICDPHRPRYALDVQLLNNDFGDAEAPPWRAVPVALPYSGQERGFFALPDPGAVVLIELVGGEPAHPIVTHVLPLFASLPALPRGSGRWNATAVSYQEHDPNGAWTRTTDSLIADQAQQIVQTSETHTSVTTDRRRAAVDDQAAAVTWSYTTESSTVLHADSIWRATTGGTMWIGSSGVNALRCLLDLCGVVETLGTHTDNHAKHNGSNGPMASDAAAAAGIAASLRPFVE